MGLRHKNFCIFNEQYAEGEYLKKVEELGEGGAKDPSLPGAPEAGAAIGVAGAVEKLKLKHPHISLYSLNAENSFGNYIVGSKNSYYVFKVHSLEDCFYMYDCQEDKDCMDCCAFNKSELCYGCIENSMLYNCNFMYWCANCVDCSYLMYSFDCENCFGCFGLKHKKFCILNEPCASKEEYFARVGKIVGQMKKEGSYMNGLVEAF